MALGKSLAEIGQLNAAELDAWREFYVLYPFDDLHRYHRPAALIASRSAKEPGQAFDAYMEALAPRPVPPEFSGLSEADRRTMAALGHPDFKR